MNKFIASVIVALCTFGLAGCQNMFKQNTAASGVAGGSANNTVSRSKGRVVTAATSASTTSTKEYIGGKIGQNMDQNDRMQMNNALEDNPVGQAANWSDERTHTNYQVIPTKNVAVKGNHNCREYRTVTTINGKEDVAMGAACRARNGQWKAVN